MSDSPIPKTWREAVPYMVWGILVFAFGFEGVGALIHGEYWPAALGASGMIFLTAFLIHWKLFRETLNNVRWLTTSMMLALAVTVFSPYVKYFIWPFDWPSASTSINNVPRNADNTKNVATASEEHDSKTIASLREQIATKDEQLIKLRTDQKVSDDILYGTFAQNSRTGHLITALLRVFDKIKSNRAELRDMRERVFKQNTTDLFHSSVSYVVPPCSISVYSDDSSTSRLAQIIVLLGQAEDCQVTSLAPPLCGPPSDGDNPSEICYKRPNSAPFTRVVYPKPDELHALSSNLAIPMLRQAISDEVFNRAGIFKNEEANDLMDSLQNCSDTRRSTSIKDIYGRPADRWTIYIILAKDQGCR